MEKAGCAGFLQKLTVIETLPHHAAGCGRHCPMIAALLPSCPSFASQRIADRNSSDFLLELGIEAFDSKTLG